jgi:hypothetical protein
MVGGVGVDLVLDGHSRLPNLSHQRHVLFGKLLGVDVLAGAPDVVHLRDDVVRLAVAVVERDDPVVRVDDVQPCVGEEVEDLAERGRIRPGLPEEGRLKGLFALNCHVLAYKFFWKQQKQLAKTTSSFSPRNRAALLKPGAVAPG